MFNVEVAEAMRVLLSFSARTVSSERFLQENAAVVCDDRLHSRRAGAGSTRDWRFSFRKDPQRRALWIATVQQKDLEPKTKETVVSVDVIFFRLSGKPFSDESHPDFPPCVVHASAKTNADRQPGRTFWPIQAFCRTIPPWHRSACTLPGR